MASHTEVTGENREPLPVRCDDPSTWRRKGEKIDLPRLLELIEENGGPMNLDLHGADLSELDARPEALRPYVDDYRNRHGVDAEPPWLTRSGWPTICIDLRFAHLEHANLGLAHLENALLFGAHLEDAFLASAFLEDAVLHGAHLENADLFDAHLGNVNLRGAHLENANLVAAHLEKAFLAGAHLENAILYAVRLYGAFCCASYLNRTEIHRESLGHAIGEELAAKGQASFPTFTRPTFHNAREAYLILKANFDSIGRYDDASWAYVKEQQMEKAMCFPTTASHAWIRERMGGAMPPPWWGPQRLPRWLWWKLRSSFYHSCLFVGLCPRHVRAGNDDQPGFLVHWGDRLSPWRWARNWFYELTTGYGERPWNPIIVAAVCIAAFAVGYWATTAVRGFWDAVAYSIATFATFNLARPATQPQGFGVEIASAVQAMLGISLFALFVFTLGNRMRRS